MSWTNPGRRPPPGARASLLACAIALASLMAPGATRADDNHYQNYLVGERAVGFGGAFTAVADDGSAVYYNPAGLTQLSRSSLNLSAAIYGFANDKIRLQSASFVDGGDTTATSTFITYPTTAVWIQKLRDGAGDGAGRMLAAISLITPFSKVDRHRSAYTTLPELSGAGTRQSAQGIETQLIEDDSLWIGLTYAWRPLARLHVGASLFFTLRSGIYQFYDVSVQSQFTTTQGLSLVEGQSLRIAADLTHYGLIGLLGVLVDVSAGLKIAATFRMPQISLASSVETNIIQAERDTPGQPIDVQQIKLGGDFHDKKPWHATLGVAYSRPRRFGASIDVSLYGPLSDYHVIKLDGDIPLFPLEHHLLFQLNVGGEFYPVPWLALRAGFFTNLSSFKGPASCGAQDDACRDRLDNPFGDPIDRYGFSGAISYEITHATLTLAFSYDLGQATRNYSPEIVATARRSFLFFVLGASFRF